MSLNMLVFVVLILSQSHIENLSSRMFLKVCSDVFKNLLWTSELNMTRKIKIIGVIGKSCSIKERNLQDILDRANAFVWV